MKTALFVITTLFMFQASAAVSSALPQKTKVQIQAKQKNSANAVSASEASAVQKSVVVPQSNTTSWVKERLSVGLFFSSASEFNSTSGNISQNGSAQPLKAPQLNSSSALGLTAKLSDQFSGAVGWYGALSLDQERAFDSLDSDTFGATSKSVKFNSERLAITPIVLSGGAQVNFSNDFYAFAGLNRPVITNTVSIKNLGFNVEPLIGYQFGGGVNLQKNLALELNVRSIRYDFKLTDNTPGLPAPVVLTLNEATLQGLNLTANYKF
jgi:hypothetical protein